MLAKDFYYDIYWPICQERLREVTQVSYYGCWKNHIEPAIGDMDFNDITPRYLDKWLKEKHITASVWRVTKAFIRTAYKYEEIDRDPCDRCLNAPPRKRPEPPTLSYWQMQELMDGLQRTPIYTTICCSCYCGLRREEACALEWEDFEWGIENGELSYVNITKGVQYLRGREIIVEPKTHLSRRRLPIPHDLVRRIYPYRSTGRLLGNLHVHQAAARYREWTKKLDLPYVPMSNLRTSWATYMVNSGAPISLISRYMGHADVETTVRWYTKPSESDLNELTKMWTQPSVLQYDADLPEFMSLPVSMVNHKLPEKVTVEESVKETVVQQENKTDDINEKIANLKTINRKDLPEKVDIKYILLQILGIDV